MTTSAAALEAFHLGAPRHVHALTVYPVFGPAPNTVFASFSQGLGAGLSVQELGEDGTVGQLQLVNPTAAPVLVFEGEEVHGARQNRIFAASVLAGSGARIEVPVHCVEEGRWDDDRHEEGFWAAPQIAYPTLRRELSAARTGTGGVQPPQRTVWAEIATRAERMASPSPTGAMHDLFEERRVALDAIASALPAQDDQVGALVMAGRECLVLDLVSRPDVWTALHHRLVQGYAMDALDAVPAEAPDHAAAGEFFAAAMTTPFRPQPTVGAGVRLQAAGGRCHGSALLVDDELVQLSVFACAPA